MNLFTRAYKKKGNLQIHHTFLCMIVIALMFFSFSANARTYYFSTSGNDNYTTTEAQNPATPWQSLVKLNYYLTNSHYLFVAGDTIAFKRGDVFANGNDAYASCWWVNRPANGFTAPSGTQANPIVLTNYGNPLLGMPNMLFPYPSTISTSQHNVFVFEGVSWITIDGLQFNDTRFPVTDKFSPAFTTGAMQLGVWTQSTATVMGSSSNAAARTRMVSNCTVKNCNFSNTTYGFVMVAGINTNIINNTFSNFKSSKDTGGINDVLGSAIEACYGFGLNISHNYISGAWAMSGITGSSNGVGGVAIDMFTVRNSKFTYNTIVDCSGFLEMGNIDKYDTTTGAQYDTFAYNKIVNSLQVAYIHGVATDNFKGYNKNLSFWNNVIIENNHSRMIGSGFGDDIYNDGQSYAQNWFWGGKSTCATTAAPTNGANCNYDGYRAVIAYKMPQLGNPDTLIDFRNNIIYNTTGTQMIYEPGRTNFKRSNNIYYLKGGYTNPTRLGGGNWPNTQYNATLSTGELLATTKLFVDTTDIHPENWDLHLATGSVAISAGTPVSITKDFEGTNVTGVPSIGIYEHSNSTVAPLNAISTSGTISCYGGTTSVTISATGGTSPYTGTGTFNVSVGNYSYIVTDAAGRRDTVSVTITQPAALTATVTSGTILVYGAKTTITVTAAGGITPYSYSLNGGAAQTSNTFLNVGAGSHTKTVLDVKGCSIMKTLTITQPASTLACTATSTAILCNGSSSSVTVNATGGTAPYTGTGVFNALAGSNTYTVTDAVGSVKTATVTITQPTAIVPSIASGRIIVYGATTTITATASGGTGVLRYKLNSGVYQSTGTFTGVRAGVDTVFIKDANGCVISRTLTITQPSALLAATATATAISCNGGSSVVTVSATGGTAPYTGTGTFTVVAGTYSYSVTDSNGVVVSTSVSITQPAAIGFSLSWNNISVYGSTTRVTLSATGGTTPYTYFWNTGVFQASNIFGSVTAGVQNFTTKDSKGCSLMKTITVLQPLKIFIVSSTNISCINQTNGAITVRADGGTAPYNFSKNNGAFSTATNFTGLPAAIYTITVRDAVNATSIIKDTILSSTSPCAKYIAQTTTVVENKNKISIFPNPSNDEFEIKISTVFSKNKLFVYNTKGEMVFNSDINNQNFRFGKNFLSGIYIAKIVSGGETKTFKIIKDN